MPLHQISSVLEITHSDSASNAIMRHKSGGQNSCVEVLYVKYILHQIFGLQIFGPQIFSVKHELSQAGGGYEAIIPHTLAH